MRRGAVDRRLVELLIFVGALLATCLATWPLCLHLTTFERLADRTLDDHVYWWDFWWLHEALLVRHVDPLFCPDVFAPHGASVVLSPFALPYGLLALPLQAWLGVLPGAVAAVKLIGFLTFPLALHGVSLLLRRLGVPLWASILAGALFAFAPFRLLHLGRIHYLAGAFVPYFLAAALQFVQRRNWSALIVAAFWFALAGATDASLLLELLIATGALLWIASRENGGVARVAGRLLACGVAGTLLLSPLLIRFFEEARSNGGSDVAARLDYDDEPDAVQRHLSPDLLGIAWYLAPPLEQALALPEDSLERSNQNRSCARLAADIYDSLRAPAEWPWLETAIGGVLLVLIAGASGAAFFGSDRRGAWAALALALVGFVLALGPRRGDGDGAITLPYAWLAQRIPGMAAGRYPAAHLRLFHLGSALLAGFGLARLSRGALLTAAGGALLYFGTAWLRPFTFAPVVHSEAHQLIAADPAPGNVLELPPRREIVLRRMALGQILHGRKLASGPLTRVPPEARSLFESEPVVQRLMHPPPPTSAMTPELRQEIDEDRDALCRYDIRFIVVRRGLIGTDAAAFEWLVAYLHLHGCTIFNTREGHVVARRED